MRHSESDIFSFMDIKPSAYIITNLAGEIVYCNNRFTKLFQADNISVINHNFAEYFTKDDGETGLSFGFLQRKLLVAESVEIDTYIKIFSIMQFVNLTAKKLNKEGGEYISIKISPVSSQAQSTISDKKILLIINKCRELQGNIDEILKAVCKIAYEEVHGDFVIIKIKNSSNEFYFRSGYNLPAELDKQKVETVEGSLCASIFSSKKPVTFSNLLSANKNFNEPIIKKYGIKSFLGIPLFNRNQEVIGALTLYDHYIRSFDMKDMKIMHIISGRLSEELSREIAAKLMEESSLDKSDLSNETAISKLSPISDVGSFVNKVSGIDINNINMDTRLGGIRMGGKKLRLTQNNQYLTPGVSDKKNEQSIVKWDNVMDPGDALFKNMGKIINLVNTGNIGLGIIKDEELIYANDSFIELKECKINKIYKTMTGNSFLPASKILAEEKKSPELKEKDILEHCFVRMTNFGGEVFEGDISAGMIVLQEKDVLEIIVSKKNFFSKLLGYAGMPITSILNSANSEEKKQGMQIKEKIFKELENKSQIYFKNMVDIIFLSCKT
ncbi:GAF domain-containing protein [Candidatus Desantisbacteria bacterium]|nr:GAF domain-containing protein [Candidatus Desantisbacteria bacterium]